MLAVVVLRVCLPGSLARDAAGAARVHLLLIVEQGIYDKCHYHPPPSLDLCKGENMRSQLLKASCYRLLLSVHSTVHFDNFILQHGDQRLLLYHRHFSSIIY